jgi:hypothetical protein
LPPVTNAPSTTVPAQNEAMPANAI